MIEESREGGNEGVTNDRRARTDDGETPSDGGDGRMEVR